MADTVSDIIRAVELDAVLGKHKKDPLKDERLLRKLEARPWLIMQLGGAVLAGDAKREEQIHNLLDKLSRNRGRPTKERPPRRHPGRPRSWNTKMYNLLLNAVKRAETSERYKVWLGGQRDSDRAKLLYILEVSYIDKLPRYEAKVKANSELRTFQNALSRARRIVTKTS